MNWHTLLIAALAFALLALVVAIGHRDGSDRIARATGGFDRDRAALAADNELDAGIDILGPASAWHPADDGFGAEIYQPEPPAIHQRAAGHPRSALYVRPCARSTKGRHTR